MRMLWQLALALCLLVGGGCGGPQQRAGQQTKAMKPRPKPPRPRPAPKPRKGPPPARRGKVAQTIHGVKVADPYRWLERAGSAEARAWTRAQDAHARRYLGGLPGRQLLEQRLTELSYIDSISAPVRRGRRFFFSRQHADKEKVVWYWRQGQRGKPRVLIDPNTLSEDGSVSLRGLSISWDGLKVAYKLSQHAADEATMYVMDVGSGDLSKVDVIEGAKYAHASWTPKGDGFYYTRLPTDKSIPVADLPGYAEVYFHQLGTEPRTDRLVHAKTGDPTTFIAADLSRDGRFLWLYLHHGWTSTEVHYQDLSRKGPHTFRPFAVGTKAHYEVTAHKGWIYVLTDDGAPNYRLYKVNPRRVQRSAWREIVPERQDAVLQGFAVVGDHLSLQYLKDASTRLLVANLAGKVIREVTFPGIGSASGLVGNPEDDTAYFSFSSFTTPTTIFRTSVRRGGRRIYFRPKIPIDPRPYRVEQVFFPSKDGTRISMFIVRRKDQPMDGSTPFLLGGYGGFNISITPQFYGARFVWLEQGGGMAVPNLRGGGEYGEDWHRAGMLTRKQNTFDDFVAAARFLIDRGYTSAAKLAIRGGSNGGLLVGAAMIQRPELFRAVACHVPLLDMVRYHLFGSGKTWISEYGSAEDPQQFKALYAYSPYHHVREGTPYPALLVMSADSDDRVDPMHARKFTAAIQHATTSGHPVLLRVETKAGHGGGDLIKKEVAAATDEYAFLLRELGVVPRRRAPSRLQGE
jgi:prolyl oligopeptidase